jgi:hypothetical protein
MGNHTLAPSVLGEVRDVRRATEGLPEERRYLYTVTKTDPVGRIAAVHIFADGLRCFGYQEVLDMLESVGL